MEKWKRNNCGPRFLIEGFSTTKPELKSESFRVLRNLVQNPGVGQLGNMRAKLGDRVSDFETLKVGSVFYRLVYQSKAKLTASIDVGNRLIFLMPLPNIARAIVQG